MEEKESLVQLLGLSTEERMQRTIKVQERRINGLRKGLSRCVTGSNNSKKIMAKISRAEQKIANTKKHLRKCF